MKTKKQGTVSLQFIWGLRLKLFAEGDKLYAEGNKLHAEGDKLWAEGDKLYAEGSKLYAEGDKLWDEAVIEAYGNVPIEWKTNGHTVGCKVEGITYTNKQKGA